MAQVVITINYREYAVVCENGQELHIMKLARLLDEKAKALTQALGHINESQLLAMIGLLIADELTETQKAAAVPAPSAAISPDTLSELDTELSENINSLNESIKSVALKLKSL